MNKHYEKKKKKKTFVDLRVVFPQEPSPKVNLDADLESKQEAEREDVTAEEKEAAEAELERRVAARQQETRRSQHAEGRQREHGQREASTAPWWPEDRPHAPGQVTAQTLKGRPVQPHCCFIKAGITGPTSRGPLYPSTTVSHSSMLALRHCSENSWIRVSGSVGSV